MRQRHRTKWGRAAQQVAGGRGTEAPNPACARGNHARFSWHVACNASDRVSRTPPRRTRRSLGGVAQFEQLTVVIAIGLGGAAGMWCLGQSQEDAIAGNAGSGATPRWGVPWETDHAAGPAAPNGDSFAAALLPVAMAAEGQIPPHDPSKTVPGIDVSHWQGTIDWDAVAGSGMKYAFIRVSDGTGTIDTEFDRNWAEAQRVGLYRGAYQYFRPNQDPIAQAKLLVEKVGRLGPNDLPPVLDLEAGGNEGIPAERIVSAALEWVKYVEEHTGKRPIIYTGKYYWEGEVGASPAFADYLLWVPNYSAEWPLVPDPWQTWAFFQHTSEGRVPGVAGNVDMNHFNGDEGDLARLADASVRAAEAVLPLDLTRARQTVAVLLGQTRARRLSRLPRHAFTFESGATGIASRVDEGGNLARFVAAEGSHRTVALAAPPEAPRPAPNASTPVDAPPAMLVASEPTAPTSAPAPGGLSGTRATLTETLSVDPNRLAAPSLASAHLAGGGIRAADRDSVALQLASANR